MATRNPGRTAFPRRAVLKLAAGGGIAGALVLPRRATAADVTLDIWTGYPELVPFYQSVADDYAKTNPGTKFTFFSTSLRETEQKLSAAVPTGTGPTSTTSAPTSASTSSTAGLSSPTRRRSTAT